jgi:hypothetical protein
MTNTEILSLARQRAADFGEPAPETVDDVERLTGIMYTGPDPKDIGKSYSVPVQQAWTSDHWM